MHAPSGVSASFQKKNRLTVQEDDPTVAPPAMSAYSIAVFSNNSASAEELEPAQIGTWYNWRLLENTALKESLKRKLSIHFNCVSKGSTSPSATSPSSAAIALKSPITRYSSTASSNGTAANSHSFSGATGTTSYMANISHGQGNTSSLHSSDISGAATFTCKNSCLLEDLSDGVSVQGNPHSKSSSKIGVKAKTTSVKGNASRNAPWSDEAPERNNRRCETESDFKDNLRPSSCSSSSHQQSTSSPSRLELRHLALHSSEENPCVSNNFSRPMSSGNAAKKPRFTRRFTSLGPPKRASEMLQTSPPQVSIGAEPNTELDTCTPTSAHNSWVPSKHNALLKRKVSPDSDFFKTLKRLKEASPNYTTGERPPSLLSRPRPESPLPSSISSHVALKDHQSIQRKKVNSSPHGAALFRQPLQNVSLGLLNVVRNSGEFKKPQIPKFQVAEKRAIPQGRGLDTTSQIPLTATVTRSSSSRSDDGRKKTVISVNGREYEKLDILGRGGSSKVYKVRSLTDKKAYALKKVSIDQFDESCVRGFKGEIDLLVKLKNEVRVISLIDHAAGSGSLYLLMECGDLDLAHVLQNKLTANATLDPNFVRFHASEVFHCIQAVHNAGIVHSDLKPANFLFVGGILKIIDFGIANAVPEHTVNIYRHLQIGTPNYMAPEALVEVNHTLSFSSKIQSTTWRVGRPSDIWSCGCIVYQMIYGRPPYALYSGQQRIMAIMNPEVQVQYPGTGLGGKPVPLSAIVLMKKCLARNPNDRWSVEECLDCDFLKPKAVNEHFVKDLLHNAVSLGLRSQNLEGIDDKTYNELVHTILAQIKDLNFA